MLRLTQEQIEALQHIGKYYLNKCENDYDKAAEAVERIRITRIEVKDNTISLWTRSPGVLIGKMGRNIESLPHYLEKQYNKQLKVKLYEEMEPDLLYFLTPQEPDPYEE